MKLQKSFKMYGVSYPSMNNVAVFECDKIPKLQESSIFHSTAKGLLGKCESKCSHSIHCKSTDKNNKSVKQKGKLRDKN